MLLSMFSEPVVKGVDRATGLLGGYADGEVGLENEVNGFAFDFSRKVSARHREERENESTIDPMTKIILSKQNLATTRFVAPLQNKRKQI